MRPLPIAVLALAVAVLLCAPSRAQQINPNGQPSNSLGMNLMQGKSRNPEAEERRRQIDNEYQHVRRGIPEQKTSSDPWGNMRGNEQAAPAQKPAPSGKKQKQQAGVN